MPPHAELTEVDAADELAYTYKPLAQAKENADFTPAHSLSGCFLLHIVVRRTDPKQDFPLYSPDEVDHHNNQAPSHLGHGLDLFEPKLVCLAGTKQTPMGGQDQQEVQYHNTRQIALEHSLCFHGNKR